MTDEARCCAAARADADARWTAAVEGLAAELEGESEHSGPAKGAAYRIAAARLRGLVTGSEEQR
jgi:hypothetical protein